MKFSDMEKDHTGDVKSRVVDIPQLPSSSSSDSRSRSGSDGTCGSGESMDTSGREDSSEKTSLGDEEGGNDVGDSNASEAKIADAHFDEEHNSHNDDVGRLIVDGDHEIGKATGAGAEANIRIGQMRQKTADKMDHTMETSAVKQVSHLIRSVEIDALCLWDGDGQNEPVTDTRIMMVVCILISL